MNELSDDSRETVILEHYNHDVTSLLGTDTEDSNIHVDGDTTSKFVSKTSCKTSLNTASPVKDKNNVISSQRSEPINNSRLNSGKTCDSSSDYAQSPISILSDSESDFEKKDDKQTDTYKKTDTYKADALVEKAIDNDVKQKDELKVHSEKYYKLDEAVTSNLIENTSNKLVNGVILHESLQDNNASDKPLASTSSELKNGNVSDCVQKGVLSKKISNQISDENTVLKTDNGEQKVSPLTLKFKNTKIVSNKLKNTCPTTCDILEEISSISSQENLLSPSLINDEENKVFNSKRTSSEKTETSPTKVVKFVEQPSHTICNISSPENIETKLVKNNGNNRISENKRKSSEKVETSPMKRVKILEQSIQTISEKIFYEISDSDDDDFENVQESLLQEIVPKKEKKRKDMRKCGSALKIRKALNTNKKYNNKVKSHKKTNKKTAKAKTNRIILYECGSCRLLFHKKADIQKHFKSCKPSSQSGKRCPHCGYIFCSRIAHIQCSKLLNCSYEIVTVDQKNEITSKPHSLTTELVSDKKCTVVLQKLQIPDSSSAKKVEINNNIYKCTICSLHFLTKDALDKHISKSDHNLNSGQICANCGLKFLSETVVEHLLEQHYKLKLQKDFNIIIPQTEQSTALDKENRTVLKTYTKEVVTINNQETETEEISGNNTSDGNTFENSSDIGRTDQNIVETNKGIVTSKISKVNVSTSSSGYKYNNHLYTCHTCSLNFLGTREYSKHMCNYEHNVERKECNICGLLFTEKVLNRHVVLHHERLKLSLKDFHFVNKPNLDSKTESKNTAQLSKENVEKEIESIAESYVESKGDLKLKISFRRSTENNCKAFIECHPNIALNEAQRDMGTMNKIEDFTKFEDEELKQFLISNALSEVKKYTKQSKKTLKKLFKCSKCDVYYMKQNSCYKHVKNHRDLMMREHIECKFCHFQIYISHIDKHFKKHHSNGSVFNYEEMLITEYIIGEGKDPIVHTYFPTNTTQSEHISTTSDGDTQREFCGDFDGKPTDDNVFKKDIMCQINVQEFKRICSDNEASIYSPKDETAKKSGDDDSDIYENELKMLLNPSSNEETIEVISIDDDD